MILSSCVFGTLIQRYKRFLADIELDTGEVITAHCPNSGRLYGVTEPGLRVGVTYEPNPKRRYPWTWQCVQHQHEWIGVNTHLPNTLVAEALENKSLSPFINYLTFQREVSYGSGSRIDFLLDNKAYLEVKNVHMCRQKGLAEFPDSVTVRGSKHLKELAILASQNISCYLVYVIQRYDIDSFKIAQDIDPIYAASAAKAKESGVRFMAFRCHVDPPLVSLKDEVKIVYQ